MPWQDGSAGLSSVSSSASENVGWNSADTSKELTPREEGPTGLKILMSEEEAPRGLNSVSLSVTEGVGWSSGHDVEEHLALSSPFFGVSLTTVGTASAVGAALGMSIRRSRCTAFETSASFMASSQVSALITACVASGTVSTLGVSIGGSAAISFLDLTSSGMHSLIAVGAASFEGSDLVSSLHCFSDWTLSNMIDSSLSTSPVREVTGRLGAVLNNCDASERVVLLPSHSMGKLLFFVTPRGGAFCAAPSMDGDSMAPSPDSAIP
mmetsp:Transcript_27376/g.50813  ORF Transcript_27376/g.50813 Transcript_27376/m.50813 type:complete len:266 (+) Transcript_27376:709-1506(+)